MAYPDQDYKTKAAGFQKIDFTYDEDKDVYICPAKQELSSNGTLYDKKGRTGQVQNQIKVYKASYKTCAECPFAKQCLTAASHENRHGRSIERSLYEEAVINNRLRVINNRDKYKRRQAIVEHPFGTIKRSWGYYYTLLKGKEKVEGGSRVQFGFPDLQFASGDQYPGGQRPAGADKNLLFSKNGYSFAFEASLFWPASNSSATIRSLQK